MLNPNDSNIEDIRNLERSLKSQISKLEKLREEVRELKFVPVDPMGSYTSITYKAIDGGKMKISFEPLEIDLIEVADSYGNLKMKFVLPKESDENEYGKDDLTEEDNFLDGDPIVRRFLDMLGKKSVQEISEILNQSDTYMELSEWACIFEKIANSNDDPVILMRDGLLRTKKIKAELIPNLWEILKEKKRLVKLVGVSKTSKVMTLLSTAISMEHIFPGDSIGYVKIPKHLEVRAYRWSGKGKISEKKNNIFYAFGDLYIAKLSRNSNLLVTVEIPRDWKNEQEIYSEREIAELMAHLAKDSGYSYPVLGYPQTIMRAHEAAARVGFPASIVRDKIMDKLREMLDEDGRDFMRDASVLTEFVNKGVLGGGYIDE
ncbi:DNA double-strand break repair nuclease NurA [Ferroplasma acidiphilum]|uniref:DNA double-strand break repair nuclease NurA n=1 Tax=Ferroplasma acidiphilum TaxID=74969 RepID=A0A7K4FPH8_9ARCH|nr:DNA double-strand break repair nuclease NurA [Ferroplasma acidiphilum]NOL60930.1 DNA double-strand break repair nuclease NurA [Ferroplasma acidiphilum]